MQMKSLLSDSGSIQEDKKILLNFISYDFLNIAEHPYVKKNAIKYVLKWGSGASSHPIVSQQLGCQQALESRLAKLLGKESCIFFQPSQNIHSILLGLLLTKNSLAFIDQGCASNLYKALPQSTKIIPFAHNDVKHLEKLLIEYKEHTGPKWIILESLSSQDGDLIKLKEFIEISNFHSCFVYLEESNTFSILGHHGLGVGALKKDIDCIVGSFQRGSGLHASFFLSKALLKNYIIESNQEISSLQLLPPATLGSIESYLELIPDMHSERQKVAHQSRFLRNELQDMGFCIKKSQAHIILIQFDNEENFQSFVDHLVEENILAYIHKQEMMVRLIITMSHDRSIIKEFLDRMKLWQRPLIYSSL